MSEIKDGGFAFPSAQEPAEHTEFGMTVRQWYAGQALKGILASMADPGVRRKACVQAENNRCEIVDVVAGMAHEYADAMLKHEGRE